MLFLFPRNIHGARLFPSDLIKATRSQISLSESTSPHEGMNSE